MRVSLPACEPHCFCEPTTSVCVLSTGMTALRDGATHLTGRSLEHTHMHLHDCKRSIEENDGSADAQARQSDSRRVNLGRIFPCFRKLVYRLSTCIAAVGHHVVTSLQSVQCGCFQIVFDLTFRTPTAGAGTLMLVAIVQEQSKPGPKHQLDLH